MSMEQIIRVMLPVIYIIANHVKTTGGKLKWNVGKWTNKKLTTVCDEFND